MSTSLLANESCWACDEKIYNTITLVEDNKTVAVCRKCYLEYDGEEINAIDFYCDEHSKGESDFKCSDQCNDCKEIELDTAIHGSRSKQMVSYVKRKPDEYLALQWTGENRDEFIDYFGIQIWDHWKFRLDAGDWMVKSNSWIATYSNKEFRSMYKQQHETNPL